MVEHVATWFFPRSHLTLETNNFSNTDKSAHRLSTIVEALLELGGHHWEGGGGHAKG